MRSTILPAGGTQNIPIDDSRCNNYYGCVTRLADEIKMSRPFPLLEEEATLSIIRTADVLLQRTAELLKKFELSPSQYNVLRILRGAKEPLACGQIAERMVSRDPDITRLLDRMEARALISRARDGQDRRVVKAQITGKGLRLLDQIGEPLTDHHRQAFAAFSEKKLKQLVEWMEQVRASI
jgi:DNA-binding MarR family transcriptional regulator